MNYLASRHLFKPGDLIALSNKSWKTWNDIQVQVVRLATESEYSHVGLIWAIGGRLFVIESVQPYARIIPLSLYAEHGFYWIPLDAPIGDAELEFALASVATWRYSKWQAVMAFFRRLKIGADQQGQCSEFVIECRRQSGVDLGAIATPSAVVLQAMRRDAAVYWVETLKQ